MTGKWKVINVHRDGLTHKEKFRDDMLVIKPGEYVLMDYEDAVMFKGQYFPMVMNAQGVQDPASYKMIKIEALHAEIEPDLAPEKIYVCHVDGKEFMSKILLEEYVKENYSHLIAVDEVAETEIKKRKR